MSVSLSELEELGIESEVSFYVGNVLSSVVYGEYLSHRRLRIALIPIAINFIRILLRAYTHKHQNDYG
jgi:hypothetical protein